MSKIKIKNFGPICGGSENNDWIDIKKLTVMIGNQGSGKSTVAKLISTFSWIEKDLFRSGEKTLRFRKQERAFRKYLEYHRINNYLRENTEIEYVGEAYRIKYNFGKQLEIKKTKNYESYLLPKITYFPAERNFVSSIKKSSTTSFSLYSASLQEFRETFQEAKEQMKEKETFALPISNVKIEYNKLNDILYIKGSNYKTQLSESASGFQSLVPMFIVAKYVSKLPQIEKEMDDKQRSEFKNSIAKIMDNKNYTEEQKQILLNKLASQFNIKRTINIIEEPEQNLFPTSQQTMLNSLLEFNNDITDNNLIITTHSPYIISYLTLAIQAKELEIKTTNNDIKNDIYEIVPKKSLISSEDVVIYELDEESGTIKKLQQYYGIPSDDNYLNSELGRINFLFSKLIDLEDLCQK